MDAVFGDCWGCKSPTKGIKCEKCNVAEYCSTACRRRYRYIHSVHCPICVALSFCASCGNKPSDLKRCSRCHSAYYCNTDCQKRHWTSHKLKCNGLIESVKCIATFVSLSTGFIELPWYLGTTFAEDYLNLSKNEGVSYDSPLKLLFIGVGDLKDVVKTVVDIPKRYSKDIEFVLNDYSPHIIARNLLFLYCALVSKNAHHLIQIWYSVCITSKCLKFLKTVLKTLVDLSREEILSKFNALEIKDSHYSICKEVWKGWLGLANDNEAMKKIPKSRQKLFEGREDIAIGLLSYYSSVPEFHIESLKAFIKDGIFLAVNDNRRAEAIYGNPTMACYNPMIKQYNEKFPDINVTILHLPRYEGIISTHDEMIYSVRDDAIVFKCWDYLDVKKKVGVKPDIIQMYSNYLASVYTRFSEYVHQRNIRLHFIVGDFQELDKDLTSVEKFDRIATSNLCDYFPTPYVLEKIVPYLNFKNKHSVVICRYENWPRSTFYWDLFSVINGIEICPLIFNDINERPEVLDGLEKSSKILASSSVVICQEDYFESYSYVFKILLSDSLMHQHKKTKSPVSKLSPKHPEEEARRFELNFRDFRIELNRVVPFIREGNIRRVSIMRNNFRYVEWHLLKE